MFRALHFSAVICVLAGLAALSALALNGSFLLVFVCLCFMTVASFAMVALHARLHRGLERSGQVLGQFSRGQLQARIQPGDGNDACTRLQHRINNMLDLLDLHLRGQEAAIDLAAHAGYAEKLRATGLSLALSERADGAEPVPQSAPAGGFLQELRAQAAALLSPEPVPDMDAQWVQQLHRQSAQAGQRLRLATEQLAQRAMQPAAPEKSAHGSFAHVEAGCARMAEQATVLSLNMAIEAGRAPADSPVHGAVDALRQLARQLQQWRAELAQYSERPVAAAAVASVPLSVAMEALTSAEQQWRAQEELLQAMLDGPAPAEAA